MSYPFNHRLTLREKMKCAVEAIALVASLFLIFIILLVAAQ